MTGRDESGFGKGCWGKLEKQVFSARSLDCIGTLCKSCPFPLVPEVIGQNRVCGLFQLLFSYKFLVFLQGPQFSCEQFSELKRVGWGAGWERGQSRPEVHAGRFIPSRMAGVDSVIFFIFL